MNCGCQLDHIANILDEHIIQFCNIISTKVTRDCIKFTVMLEFSNPGDMPDPDEVNNLLYRMLITLHSCAIVSEQKEDCRVKFSDCDYWCNVMAAITFKDLKNKMMLPNRINNGWEYIPR